MSLEVLLIPIGIAAVAAWRESRSTDLCEKCKSTAIRDQPLLEAALARLGARVTAVESGRVRADSPFGALTFQRVGDVFLGRVDGEDDERTNQMLTLLEQEVGKQVQAETVERVRAQATAMGMTLLMQRNENGEVQLVFEQAS